MVSCIRRSAGPTVGQDYPGGTGTILASPPPGGRRHGGQRHPILMSAPHRVCHLTAWNLALTPALQPLQPGSFWRLWEPRGWRRLGTSGPVRQETVSSPRCEDNCLSCEGSSRNCSKCKAGFMQLGTSCISNLTCSNGERLSDHEGGWKGTAH